MGHHSLRELLPIAHPVSIPLATEFRGLAHREAVIFDAPDGPAEWSPFTEYGDEEAARWLASALEQGFQAATTPAPTKPVGTIRVNGTLPAIPAEQVASFLARLGMPSTVKVKVGGPGSSRAKDIARVAAVRVALGPSGRIRLDANGSWTLDEAEHTIRDMEHLDIDYVEQPVEALADLAQLRSRIARLGIQVAADESIRRSSDIDAVIAASACDVVVIKVQPLGGIHACLSVIEKARNAGLQVVVSSALETSVGLHYAAQLQLLLAETNSVVLDAGLATASLLAGDVVVAPLIADGSDLLVRPLSLDTAALKRFALPSERQKWWFSRLERCLALV
jgi:O-succinylbenzoate synthase